MGTMNDWIKEMQEKAAAANDARRRKQMEIEALVKRILWIAVPVFFLLLVLVGSFYTVEQGERAVVTRMGAAVRVTGPGAHAKMPFFESVERINVQTNSIEWAHYRADNGKEADSRMESYSRDQQAAHLSVKVAYHANSDSASVLQIFSQYRSVNGYESQILVPRTYEAVKAVFGKYSAAEAVQNRTRLNGDFDTTLRGLLPKDAPITIEGIQIQDIKFSQGYENAINDRMKAEVEVTKVAQELERERKQAEIRVVQAKAAADAEVARAEAEAKATRLQGDAAAAAIRVRGDALRENPKLIDLTVAERWDGKLPTTMVPEAAVPFIHVR